MTAKTADKREAKRRTVVCAAVVLLVAYVVAFIQCRSRISMRGFTAAGDQWSATIYYFVESPSANRLLVFAFSPLAYLTGGRVAAVLREGDETQLVSDRRPIYLGDPSEVLSFF